MRRIALGYPELAGSLRRSVLERGARRSG